MTGQLIRVVLVDDHELVRRGLQEMLDEEPDMAVVGQAATAADALAEIDGRRPDVAVLDVRLPDGDGVEVCREVQARHPDVRCIMLTSFTEGDALFRAILAGAAGYALKQIRGHDLVDAIRRVAAGESLLDPGATAQVLARLRGDVEQDPLLAKLTDKERTILELVTDGLTNRQIADRVDLAEKTVKNYVSSILDKLGMSRRTEAAVYFARRGTRGAGVPGR